MWFAIPQRAESARFSFNLYDLKCYLLGQKEKVLKNVLRECNIESCKESSFRPVAISKRSHTNKNKVWHDRKHERLVQNSNKME